MVRLHVVSALLALLAVIPAEAAAETNGFTIEQAVARAIEMNPGVRALRLEEGAAEGRLARARLLFISNPAIEGSISKKDRPDEEGGGRFTNYGVRLSQEIEIAGQRGARIGAAEKELARVREEIRDHERVLISAVKDACTTAISLKKKRGFAREIVRLNEELAGYTRIKFEAGDVSALDVNLAEVELSKARKGLLQAEREYREAALALQGLLGMPPDRSFAIEGDLPSDIPSLPDKESLMTSALSSRPDARSTAYDMEKTAFALTLAQREAVPNITLSGFYDRDESRNVVGLGISIPLPVFDRKQTEIKEASARAEGAKIKAAALQKTIEREVDLAFSNMESSMEEIALFKREILIKAAENLQLLNLAFKEGKISFFEVRLAQRDTIEAQLAYIEAQTRMQLALNALEKIAGGPLK